MRLSRTKVNYPLKPTSGDFLCFFSLNTYREAMRNIDALNTSPILKGIGKTLTTLKLLMDMGIIIALLAIALWKLSGLL